MIASIVCVMSLVGVVMSYPGGSPSGACSSMLPSHGYEVQPEITNPYAVSRMDGVKYYIKNKAFFGMCLRIIINDII